MKYKLDYFLFLCFCGGFWEGGREAATPVTTEGVLHFAGLFASCFGVTPAVMRSWCRVLVWFSIHFLDLSLRDKANQTLF